jgi:putative membrane protein
MYLRAAALVPILALLSPTVALSAQDKQPLQNAQDRQSTEERQMETQPNMGQRQNLGAANEARQSLVQTGTETRPLSPQDREFFNTAVRDSKAQIELGLLAENRSNDPSVKGFSRLMIVDQMGLLNEIALIAGAHHLDLERGAAREGEIASRLQDLRGAQFDREFIQQQVQNHTRDIQRFTEMTQSTQNPAVKGLAYAVIPILQQHADLARAVETQLQDTSRSVQR